MKRFVGFAGRVTVAHVVSYIAVGALAYPLLTREFFEGSAGLAVQVMRTPAEPALWAHVTRWMLPFQILRGVLIALVLYPFLGTITRWSYRSALQASRACTLCSGSGPARLLAQERSRVG